MLGYFLLLPGSITGYYCVYNVFCSKVEIGSKIVSQADCKNGVVTGICRTSKVQNNSPFACLVDEKKEYSD